MKVLVTGGNGFIGSHLVDALLTAGLEVSVLDKYDEKYRQPNRKVDYFKGSYLDTSILGKAMSGVDVVIHLANSTVPGTSNLNMIEDVEDNLVGTIKLFDIMIRLGVNKLIYLSSGGAVYGNPPSNPVTEDLMCYPISSYGVVKSSVEKYIHLHNHLGSFQSVVIRPSNPFGPRQSVNGVQGVISRFLYLMAQNRSIEIWGDGEAVRDYFYVTDLADLCLAAVKDFKPGVYNAGSGLGLSINQLLQSVSEVVGKEPEIERKGNRPSDVQSIILDISKSKRVYDWTPTVGLHEGIQRHWDWVRQL